MKKLNLAKRRFGRLLVIKEVVLRDKHGDIFWDCLCDCGNTATVSRRNLRKGDTKSCGCYAEEVGGKSRITHGCSSNPIYQVWRRMIDRCYNPNTGLTKTTEAVALRFALNGDMPRTNLSNGPK